MGRPRELSDAERADLMARGFRPVEVWIPDWDSPTFKARLSAEAEILAKADALDPDIDDWVIQVRGDLWSDVPS